MAGAWNSPRFNCVGVWAPGCPRISAPSLRWLLAREALVVAAFDVPLFWMEDVGLRERLDDDGAASRIPDADLTKPQEFPQSGR